MRRISLNQAGKRITFSGTQVLFSRVVISRRFECFHKPGISPQKYGRKYYA